MIIGNQQTISVATINETLIINILSGSVLLLEIWLCTLDDLTL